MPGIEPGILLSILTPPMEVVISGGCLGAQFQGSQNQAL